MNILSAFRLALVSFLLCVFNSCALPHQESTNETVESAEIPPDMATEQFILIGTLKNRKSYDKYMTKEFANYTGKYLLANKAEITTTYQDISKYRYIMDYTVDTDFGSSSQPGSSTYRYFIKDRKANKIYPQRLRSGYYPFEIRSYLKAIEAFRKK